MKLTAYLSVAGPLLAGLIVNLASAGEPSPANDCTAGAACQVAGCLDPGACRHCARCGCNDACLVCRLVPDTKKLKVNCYAAECKPFCVPCPSHKGCRNVDCVDCSKEGVSCSQKKVAWYDWCAGDATMRSAKHLMKKPAEKKVPSFKWVVENLCDNCQAECEQQNVPAPHDAPPAPKIGAKILYGVPNVTDAAALE